MKNYLLIGLIVQLLVMILRCVILKKIDWSNMEDVGVIGWVGFCMTIVVVGAINVVTWPILIITEIICTIKGI